MEADKAATGDRHGQSDRQWLLRPAPGRPVGSRGITLIELMIVVAIVGILAAIAYPSYQEQVVKARRTDGTGALMGLAMQLEKHAYDNGTYAGATVIGLMGRDTSQEGYYQISISAATLACPLTDCYEIQAAAVTGTTQAGDTKCATFILASTGAKDVTGTCASGTDDCVEDCW